MILKNDELEKTYKFYSELNKYHYLLFRYEKGSLLFKWTHYFGGNPIGNEENKEWIYKKYLI